MTLPVRRSTTQTDRWRPFRELEDVYSELDRLMQSALGAEGTVMPSADVVETKDGYEVEIELPGVRREDIDVELIGNELAVTGEFKEREGLFRRRTRRVGQSACSCLVAGRPTALCLATSQCSMTSSRAFPRNQRRLPW